MSTRICCAGCGASLQPGFRFCGLCGTPVAGAPATPRIRITVMRSDGTPGPVFALDADDAICGRTEGAVRLPDDPTVSPRHARFSAASGRLRVEDLASVNGTFVRLKEPRRLAPGEEIRVGRQVLRLEPLPRPRAEDGAVRPWGTKDPGYRFRLSQLLEGGGLGEIFPLRDGTNSVGREAGEVTFPDDRYVSARHARLEVAEGAVTLFDVGSSNGTFVKIVGATELAPGDQLLVGGQLLRIEA